MRQADVVVIGSGAFGAAAAFALARRGGRRVALVDRHPLGSQTSPRAAGLAAQVRSTDVMTRLAQRAVQLLVHFTEDTGQPLELAQPGSIKVARTAEDAAILESEASRGERLGLETTVISGDEAHRRNPFLQPVGIVAAMHTPSDIYFEPAQVALGYATAAGALGVALLPNTTVTRVDVRDGAVRGVETDQGRIEAPVVLDAAGAWARRLAEESGIRVPMVPTRHQLFITEPIEGVHPLLPITRIMDASVYVRPCWGGLMLGGYESEPLQVDMGSVPPDFSIADTPLDISVLHARADAVRAQLPIFQDPSVRIRVHRGGIPTMTPDGKHIVGPLPGARGFFVASGCNVAGLSIAPAIGEQLAHWIVDGAPTEDLSSMSITRFGPEWDDEERLRAAASWQYWHFYSYQRA